MECTKRSSPTRTLNCRIMLRALLLLLVLGASLSAATPCPTTGNVQINDAAGTYSYSGCTLAAGLTVVMPDASTKFTGTFEFVNGEIPGLLRMKVPSVKGTIRIASSKISRMELNTPQAGGTSVVLEDCQMKQFVIQQFMLSESSTFYVRRNRFIADSTVAGHLIDISSSPLRNSSMHQWINNTFSLNNGNHGLSFTRSWPEDAGSILQLAGNDFSGLMARAFQAESKGGQIIYEQSNKVRAGGIAVYFKGREERGSRISIANSTFAALFLNGDAHTVLRNFSLLVSNSALSGSVQCWFVNVTDSSFVTSSTAIAADVTMNAKQFLKSNVTFENGTISGSVSFTYTFHGTARFLFSGITVGGASSRLTIAAYNGTVVTFAGSTFRSGVSFMGAHPNLGNKGSYAFMNSVLQFLDCDIAFMVLQHMPMSSSLLYAARNRFIANSGVAGHLLEIDNSPSSNGTVHQWINNSFKLDNGNHGLHYTPSSSQVQSGSVLYLAGNSFGGIIMANAFTVEAHGGRIIYEPTNRVSTGGIVVSFKGEVEAGSFISVFDSPGLSTVHITSAAGSLANCSVAVVNTNIKGAFTLHMLVGNFSDSSVMLLNTTTGSIEVRWRFAVRSEMSFADSLIKNPSSIGGALAIGSQFCLFHSDVSATLTLKDVHASGNSILSFSHSTFRQGVTFTTAVFSASALEFHNNSIAQIAFSDMEMKEHSLFRAIGNRIHATSSVPGHLVEFNRCPLRNGTVHQWINNSFKLDNGNHALLYEPSASRVESNSVLYLAGNLWNGVIVAYAFAAESNGGRIIYEPSNIVGVGSLVISFTKGTVDSGSHISVFNSPGLVSVTISADQTSVVLKNFTLVIVNSTLSGSVTFHCSNLTDSSIVVSSSTIATTLSLTAKHLLTSNLTIVDGTVITSHTFSFTQRGGRFLFQNTTVSKESRVTIAAYNGTVVTFAGSTFRSGVSFMGAHPNLGNKGSYAFMNSVLQFLDCDIAFMVLQHMSMSSSLLYAARNRFIANSGVAGHLLEIDNSPSSNGTVHQWINNSFKLDNGNHGLHYTPSSSQVQSGSVLYLAGNSFGGVIMANAFTSTVSGGRVVYDASNRVSVGGLKFVFDGLPSANNLINVANSPRIVRLDVTATVPLVNSSILVHSCLVTDSFAFAMTEVEASVFDIDNVTASPGGISLSFQAFKSSSFSVKGDTTAPLIDFSTSLGATGSTVFFGNMSTSLKIGLGPGTKSANITCSDLAGPKMVITLSGSCTDSLVQLIGGRDLTTFEDSASYTNSQLRVVGNTFGNYDAGHNVQLQHKLQSESVALVMDNTFISTSQNQAIHAGPTAVSGGSAVRVVHNTASAWIYASADAVDSSSSIEVSFNSLSTVRGTLNVVCQTTSKCAVVGNTATKADAFSVSGDAPRTANKRVWACNQLSGGGAEVSAPTGTHFATLPCTRSSTFERCAAVSSAAVDSFSASQVTACDVPSLSFPRPVTPANQPVSYPNGVHPLTSSLSALAIRYGDMKLQFHFLFLGAAICTNSVISSWRQFPLQHLRYTPYDVTDMPSLPHIPGWTGGDVPDPFTQPPATPEPPTTPEPTPVPPTPQPPSPQPSRTNSRTLSQPLPSDASSSSASSSSAPVSSSSSASSASAVTPEPPSPSPTPTMTSSTDSFEIAMRLPSNATTAATVSTSERIVGAGISTSTGVVVGVKVTVYPEGGLVQPGGSFTVNVTVAGSSSSRTAGSSSTDTVAPPSLPWDAYVEVNISARGATTAAGMSLPKRCFSVELLPGAAGVQLKCRIHLSGFSPSSPSSSSSSSSSVRSSGSTSDSAKSEQSTPVPAEQVTQTLVLPPPVEEEPLPETKKTAQAATGTVATTVALSAASGGGGAAADAQLMLVTIGGLARCSKDPSLKTFADGSSRALTPFDIGSGPYAGARGLGTVIGGVFVLHGLVLFIFLVRKGGGLRNACDRTYFPNITIKAFHLAYPGLAQSMALAAFRKEDSASWWDPLTFVVVCVVPMIVSWLFTKMKLADMEFTRYSPDGAFATYPRFVRAAVLPRGWWTRGDPRLHMFGAWLSPLRGRVEVWHGVLLFFYGRSIFIAVLSSDVFSDCDMRIKFLIGANALSGLFCLLIRPFRIGIQNTGSSIVAFMTAGTVVAVYINDIDMVLKLVSATTAASMALTAVAIVVVLMQKKWVPREISHQTSMSAQDGAGDMQQQLLVPPNAHDVSPSSGTMMKDISSSPRRHSSRKRHGAFDEHSQPHENPLDGVPGDIAPSPSSRRQSNSLLPPRQRIADRGNVRTADRSNVRTEPAPPAPHKAKKRIVVPPPPPPDDDSDQE